MITSNPRDSAVSAYSNIQSGVRCADTTRTSWGTPSSANSSRAGVIVSRSDALPMMTPTSGGSDASLMRETVPRRPSGGQALCAGSAGFSAITTTSGCRLAGSPPGTTRTRSPAASSTARARGTRKVR
jgi:hypothetical protein